MKPSLLSLPLIAAVLSGISVPPTSCASEAGLAPLTMLIGTWTGKDSEGKSIQARYELTAGGNSLMETLTHEQKPAMATLYHRDRDALMMTHYCSLNNQPRMRAAVPRQELGALSFTFIDVTNLASPSDPHMHRLTMTFQDRDHFQQEWILIRDDKEMPVVFRFERVR
jgi:hypothetical protein